MDMVSKDFVKKLTLEEWPSYSYSKITFFGLWAGSE